MKIKIWILFVILLAILALISFFPAFRFAFIVDDWFQLWGVFYDKSIIDYYIRTQHPNSAYEFLLLAPIFRFNPFFYQLIGYFLKVIDSIAVYFLIFSITRSRNVAVFSGLLFASSVIGLETFTRISAQNSALLIPILSLGLYFWIKADKENSLYKYILATILIGLTVLGDPGIGIMIVPMIFLWNLLNFYQNSKKQIFKKFMVTTNLLALIPLVLKWYLDTRISERNVYLSKHFYFALNHAPMVMTNFLTSIGNLLVGWIIPFPEYSSLTDPNSITKISGYFFLIITCVLGVLFIKKKSEFLKIALFLSVWIFLFYFPDWFTQTHYVEGGVISAVSNRYFAISSIGFIGLISYSLMLFKKRLAVTFLTIVIILNIWNSQKILLSEYSYRSIEVQNELYGQINQDLPKGDEKNKLILFLGTSWLKIAGLDWNGFYPIALKRGIYNKNEFSTVTSNMQQAKELICAGNQNEASKFRLSELYAWEIQNNQLYNVSENVRKAFEADNNCKYNL